MSDLDCVFGALKAAHRLDPVPSYRDRQDILTKMLGGLRRHESALLRALTQDLGKSEPEARLTEFFPIRKEIQYVRKHLSDWMRPDRRATPFSSWAPVQKS